MRTPRESFLLSGKVADFKKIVATEAFEVACDYALMQLRHELPPNTHPGLPTDPLVGFDANAQAVGAARVIQILKTIAEPVKPPATPQRPTLHYATDSRSPSRTAAPGTDH